MALQIGQALGRGVRRAASTSGIALMVVTVLYQFVFLGATYTLFASVLPPEAQAELGLVLPISVSAAAGLLVVGWAFGTLVYVVAARALSRDPTALSSFPSELYTRRIGRATLSAIGANLVISIAVTIGLIALVVPGIFLSVSFAFALFAIAVEDAGAIDSLRRSWDLASGYRWRIFGLMILVGVIGGVAGVASQMIATALGATAGELVSIVVTSVVAVVSYAIFADAYVQIREDEGGPGGRNATGAGEPSAI